MKGFYILLVFLIFSSFSFAHEVIITPGNSNVSKGSKNFIKIYSTHVFLQPEESETPSELQISILQGGIENKLDVKNVAGQELLEAYFTSSTNGAQVITAHRMPQTWSNTTRGLQQGDRKELEKKGFRVIDSTIYEKFAKTFINLSPVDNTPMKPVGQELEIVPITNPANVKPGEDLKIRILYNKSPLSTPVWATYAGFSDIPSTYAYYTECDSNGIATIKISHKGIWIIRVAHTHKNNDIRQNTYSTLTFEVK